MRYANLNGNYVELDDGSVVPFWQVNEETCQREPSFTDAEIATIQPYMPGIDEVAAVVDGAAERARLRYCPFGLQHKEYEGAYDEACAWLLDQAAPVPQPVLDGVNAQYPTALASAQLIKAMGEAYLAKLIQIRSARIQGKAAVMDGVKTLAQVVSELEAL